MLSFISLNKYLFIYTQQVNPDVTPLVTGICNHA